jgi:hypothetical protein
MGVDTRAHPAASVAAKRAAIVNDGFMRKRVRPGEAGIFARANGRQ